MTAVFSRIPCLIFLLFLTGACTHGEQHSIQNGRPAEGQLTENSSVLYKPCTRDEAEALSLKALEIPSAGLEAASCYAFLVRQEKNSAQKLADAREGRRLAEAAAQAFPENGRAHYLTACLAGLEAQNDSARGLELVPVIERDALTAAQLNPTIDNGGPDRMLGELYLRAPAFPISVGDVEKSILHYRKAVSLAPNFLQNRLGLVEALLENEDAFEACLELEKIYTRMPPKEGRAEDWKRSLKSLKKICEMCGNP